MKFCCENANSYERQVFQGYAKSYATFYGVSAIWFYWCALIVVVGTLFISDPFPTNAEYPFPVHFEPVRSIVFVQQALVGFQCSAHLCVNIFCALLLLFAAARFEILMNELRAVENIESLIKCIEKYYAIRRYDILCWWEREREREKRESSWGKSEIDGTWNLNCHQSFRRISNQFHFRWNNIIRENLLSIFFFFLKSIPSFSKLYYYYYFLYFPEIIRLLFCCVRYAEEVVNSARYTTLITLCICGVESVFGGIIFIGVSILQSYYPLLHGIN